MISPVNDRAIVEHFADFIIKSGGNETAAVAAAELCSGLIDGHICKSLSEIFGTAEISSSREELLASVVVGRPGDFKPVIIDYSDNLYLYRYWQYENSLASRLTAMAQEYPPLDTDLLSKGIERLFPRATNETDWQKIATIAAVSRRFCVISGGPGTGKSTIVRKIIELALEQAKGELLRIAMAAPTGKAAARLRETLVDSAGEVPSAFPSEVFTLHRLLGTVKGSARFRHNSANPLQYGLVIVDEASMVPLPLMAKLLDALPKDGRLVLLGDKNQLSSVEPGAVLGELCGNDPENMFTLKFKELVNNISSNTFDVLRDNGVACPLNDSIVILKKSYRFSDQSGIGRLSRLINGSKSAEAVELLNNKGLDDIEYMPISNRETRKNELKQLILGQYSEYLAEENPLAAIEKFEKFRVLCATRIGQDGVAEINREAEQILAAAGLISVKSRWYPGRPVMITANDYEMRLFNGDTGLCLPDAEREGEIAVYFQDGEKSVRKIPPSRLPEHETVFAMTVHKSQGSEFDSVLLLLPDTDSPLLTRELIYTGITRARKRIHLWTSPDIFLNAVSRKTERSSGLGRALRGDQFARQKIETEPDISTC